MNLLHANDEAWTAGAQRALLRAVQVAVFLEAAEVEPQHLFWSLLLDDGRGGERLARHGFHIHNYDAVTRFSATTATAPRVDAVAWSSDALDVLVQAQQHATRDADLGAAGTDHLVLGLVTIPSPIAYELTQAGISLQIVEPLSSLVETEIGPLADVASLKWSEGPRDRRADILRILDAAANRCREGLRVIEDYLRFVVNDAFLSQSLKDVRHDLAAALTLLPATGLLAARDTLGDVGTRIETHAEYHRLDSSDVLTAAFKRVEEALRSLEEYGKLVSELMPRRIEQLRYRVYSLEKSVLRSGQNRQRLQDQRLYVLLTERDCAIGPGPMIRAAASAGVRLFQIREKQRPDRDLIEYARRVRKLTRECESLLIINDRPDIAVLVDADGVHVGQDDLSVSEARRFVGPDRLVGVSTHNLEQARQAVLDGADYLGVGPTFPSSTKDFDEFPGLEFVRAVAQDISLPWFAIGGIWAKTIGEVAQAGAARVAVSSAVCRDPQPAKAAAQLLSWLPSRSTAAK